MWGNAVGNVFLHYYMPMRKGDITFFFFGVVIRRTCLMPKTSTVRSWGNIPDHPWKWCKSGTHVKSITNECLQHFFRTRIFEATHHWRRHGAGWHFLVVNWRVENSAISKICRARRLLCLNSGRRWIWWTLASCKRRIPRWLAFLERWWLETQMQHLGWVSRKEPVKANFNKLSNAWGIGPDHFHKLYYEQARRLIHEHAGKNRGKDSWCTMGHNLMKRPVLRLWYCW